MGGSLDNSLGSQVSERERKERLEPSRWIREVASVSSSRRTIDRGMESIED